MATKALIIHLRIVICLLLSSKPSFGAESDLQCLRLVKKSVDPGDVLDWRFDNITEGSICQFYGVECWKPDENKVLSLSLSNMGLEGQFPAGLELCTSLVGLDLSRNNLFGSIPADISKQSPYLTSLDLSYNSFSGEIPAGLAGCTYLNVLNIQHNRLTGEIPEQISQLARLKSINVADNSLSGPIPASLRFFPPGSFENNRKLCGAPLEDCKTGPPEAVIAGAIGFVVAFISALFWPPRVITRGKLSI